MKGTAGGGGEAQVNGWRVGALLLFSSTGDEFQGDTFYQSLSLEGVPECTVSPGKTGSSQVSGRAAGPGYGTVNGSGQQGLRLGCPVAAGLLASGLRCDGAAACVEPQRKTDEQVRTAKPSGSAQGFSAHMSG